MKYSFKRDGAPAKLTIARCLINNPEYRRLGPTTRYLARLLCASRQNVPRWEAKASGLYVGHRGAHSKVTVIE